MFTILGSTGFIGSNLLRWLQDRSIPCQAPARDDDLRDRPLGHVVYCIGLTGDFRFHRHETVEAHVCKVERLLHHGQFDSLTYLSSTRLYRRGPSPAREENGLWVNPSDADDIYNVSKAMGESLLLASADNVKVIRLSHVYGLDWGSKSFLSSVITDSVQHGRVVLRSALDSERDYVSIDDVVDLIFRISTTGARRMYNVARGVNVSNGQIVDRLAQITGCEVEVHPAAPTVRFPPISVERITEEFVFRPRDVLDDLADLVKLFEQASGGEGEGGNGAGGESGP
jgi:nucleoside-diphosphate-sugar epimerase